MRHGVWSIGVAGAPIAGTPAASGQVLLTPAVVGSGKLVRDAEQQPVSGVTVRFAVGAGGGSLEITPPGHPYEGLRLTIPSGTFAGRESAFWSQSTSDLGAVTMTGTITLWIWGVNADLEIEDPPQQSRFTFVATRLR